MIDLEEMRQVVETAKRRGLITMASTIIGPPRGERCAAPFINHDYGGNYNHPDRAPCCLRCGYRNTTHAAYVKRARKRGPGIKTRADLLAAIERLTSELNQLKGITT